MGLLRTITGTVTVGAALLVSGVVGCGGGGGDTTTHPLIPQAELNALEKAHSDFHALGPDLRASFESCRDVGCVDGVLVRVQAAMTVLDTQLQHGEEAATGRCKVAIQTAQAGLQGLKETVDGIKAALESHNLSALRSAGSSVGGASESFNNDLNSISGACGGGSGGAPPNA